MYVSIVFIHKRCWESIVSLAIRQWILSRSQKKKIVLNYFYLYLYQNPGMTCGIGSCYLKRLYPLAQVWHSLSSPDLMSVSELLRSLPLHYLFPAHLLAFQFDLINLYFDMCREYLNGNMEILPSTSKWWWKIKVLHSIYSQMGTTGEDWKMEEAPIAVFDDWPKSCLRTGCPIYCQPLSPAFLGFGSIEKYLLVASTVAISPHQSYCNSRHYRVFLNLR